MVILDERLLAFGTCFVTPPGVTPGPARELGDAIRRLVAAGLREDDAWSPPAAMHALPRLAFVRSDELVVAAATPGLPHRAVVVNATPAHDDGAWIVTLLRVEHVGSASRGSPPGPLGMPRPDAQATPYAYCVAIEPGGDLRLGWELSLPALGETRIEARLPLGTDRYELQVVWPGGSIARSSHWLAETIGELLALAAVLDSTDMCPPSPVPLRLPPHL